MAAAPEALVVSGAWQIDGLPATVRRAGPQAAERTVEFFTAQIRNPHTRAAYGAAVTRFFTWCDAHGLELAQLSPVALFAYIDEMHGRYRAPTIKQYLAAIRRLFDWLVIGQVVPATTRPPRYEGRHTSSGRARPRCCSPPKRGCCWILSTRRLSPACAIARCWA